MKKYTLSVLFIVTVARLAAQTTSGSINVLANNDTVTYNGSSGQVIPAATFKSDTILNLVVDNTAGVVNNGALTIGSSYILSDLASAITPLSAPGKTVVVTGSKLVINSFASTPSAGQIYTLLSAGTLTGTFSSVILPAGITGTITYPSNTVVLTISSVPMLPAAFLFSDSSTNALSPDEYKGGASFSVYPNPSRDQVAIVHGKGAAGSAIVVYTLDGRQVLRRNVIAGAVQTTIDVSKLVAGAYVVAYEEDNTTKTKIFIKE